MVTVSSGRKSPLILLHDLSVGVILGPRGRRALKTKATCVLITGLFP